MTEERGKTRWGKDVGTRSRVKRGKGGVIVLDYFNKLDYTFTGRVGLYIISVKSSSLGIRFRHFISPTMKFVSSFITPFKPQGPLRRVKVSQDG